MELAYILFSLWFIPILLVITGVEVSVAKIFFKKRQEKIIGKSSSITLYIFGAIAFWTVGSFLLFFQRGLVSYFNLDGIQFLFNVYVLSGFLCYAGYLSLNSGNYDKENPNMYTRKTMFIYLFISALIV